MLHTVDLDTYDDSLLEEFDLENCNEIGIIKSDQPCLEPEPQLLIRASRKRKVIPRVLRSDIRRHYPNMLINTLNSCNLDTIQGFFGTFMRNDSMFTIDQRIYANMGAPNRMQFQGPIQVAHYLLGLIVMTPDAAVHMRSHKIITSNKWKGTKVVLQLEYEGTKLSELNMIDWIPPVDSLGEIYQQCHREQRALSAGIFCDQTQEEVVTSRELTNTNINTRAVARVESPNSIHSRSSRSSNTSSGSSSTIASYSTEASKRRSKSTTLLRDAVNKYANIETETETSGESGIPKSFVDALYRRAKWYEKPVVYRIKGEYTIYLDETNHVLHVYLSRYQFE